MTETPPREFTGRDLVEALQEAARSFGVKRSEIGYETLEEGRKGFLGIGSRQCVIRAWPRATAGLAQPPAGPRPPRDRDAGPRGNGGPRPGPRGPREGQDARGPRGADRGDRGGDRGNRGPGGPPRDGRRGPGSPGDPGRRPERPPDARPAAGGPARPPDRARGMWDDDLPARLSDRPAGARDERPRRGGGRGDGRGRPGSGGPGRGRNGGGQDRAGQDRGGQGRGGQFRGPGGAPGGAPGGPRRGPGGGDSRGPQRGPGPGGGSRRDQGGRAPAPTGADWGERGGGGRRSSSAREWSDAQDTRRGEGRGGGGSRGGGGDSEPRERPRAPHAAAEQGPGRRQPPRPRPQEVEREETVPATDVHAAEVRDLLEEIVDRWGLDVKVSASVEDDTVRVGLDGPDGGLLSADDGRVLEALQYLVSKMTSRLLSDNVRVLIDADGFRRERDEALRERAREAAHRARDERRKLRLDPLNPYERRVVHLALKEIEGVRTYSIGRGYLKRVTIEPVEEGSEDGVTAAAAGGALAAGAAGAAAASGLDETESGRRRSRRAPQDEEELESRSKTGEEE